MVLLQAITDNTAPFKPMIEYANDEELDGEYPRPRVYYMRAMIYSQRTTFSDRFIGLSLIDGSRRLRPSIRYDSDTPFSRCVGRITAVTRINIDFGHLDALNLRESNITTRLGAMVESTFQTLSSQEAVNTCFTVDAEKEHPSPGLYRSSHLCGYYISSFCLVDHLTYQQMKAVREMEAYRSLLYSDSPSSDD